MRVTIIIVLVTFMIACTSNNNLTSDSLKKEKACKNFLKTLACYDMEIDLSGYSAYDLNKRAQRNQTTPYELSTRLSPDTCKSRGLSENDDECMALGERGLLTNYDINVCKELINSDYRGRDKIFNSLVKKYAKCYAYQEKHPKPVIDEVIFVKGTCQGVKPNH